MFGEFKVRLRVGRGFFGLKRRAEYLSDLKLMTEQS